MNSLAVGNNHSWVSNLTSNKVMQPPGLPSLTCILTHLLQYLTFPRHTHAENYFLKMNENVSVEENKISKHIFKFGTVQVYRFLNKMNKKYKYIYRIMYGLGWRTVYVLMRRLFWLRSDKGNKHQNNPWVCHDCTYNISLATWYDEPINNDHKEGFHTLIVWHTWSIYILVVTSQLMVWCWWWDLN